VNQASCDLAKQVSKEFGCLWLGGVCQTPTYLSDGNKEKVQEEFRKQTKVFVENKADFLLAEVWIVLYIYNMLYCTKSNLVCISAINFYL
jgi:methionine synthase I (cobalamin-dependent)